MKRIIVAGGTGLIGALLVDRLRERYNKITVLTRSPEKYTSSENVNYTFWDGKSLIDDILNNAHAIINLTGENIGKRKWTEDQKNKILYSRLDASRAISKSISLCSEIPKVWIHASATGYYGNASERKFYEQSPKGEGSFLADVCELWEQPVHDYIAEINIEKSRTVIIRTGVVLAQNSDFWKQMLMPFKFGVAAILADGKQYVPWIHIEDEVNAILFLLESEGSQGVYNLSAPISARFSEVIGAIKEKKKTLFSLYLPEWFLNFLFGKEKTEEIILVNQNVSPQKLLEEQFRFKYPNIQSAVYSLLEK